MNDSLGDRMKQQYEDRTRLFLPRRTYTIVRVDGKAFHGFCRSLERPYDAAFMRLIDDTALALVREMQGSQFAYTQSDEISILLTDFTKPETAAWFDGNLQKMCSVTASVATEAFNSLAPERLNKSGAHFDTRVFTIPDYVEVENYFIWRQKDAERNSVQMLAQHHYSHKELHQKSCADMHDMIHAKGDNWNNHPARFKRGGALVYAGFAWEAIQPPIFVQERDWLKAHIPRHWQAELAEAK